MKYFKMRHILAAPEEGGEQSGGGGETPQVETPTETPPKETPPNEAPKETPATTPTKEEIALPTKKEDKSKLGQVTSLVEKAGLDMVEVATIAKANDGKIDLNTLVALKEKHGDAVASLVADQIESIHKERSEAASKRDNEIYDQIKDAFKDITSDPEQTGESMWVELKGWASDNVSTEHRVEINELIAQGGLAAKLAVQELTSAFKEAQGTQNFQEADLLDGDSTPATSTGKDISKLEYNVELNKLLKAGHQYGTSREIAALDARRTKSISRGIT